MVRWRGEITKTKTGIIYLLLKGSTTPSISQPMGIWDIYVQEFVYQNLTCGGIEIHDLRYLEIDIAVEKNTMTKHLYSLHVYDIA